MEQPEQIHPPDSQTLNPQPVDLESWETSANLVRVNKSLSAVLLSLCAHLVMLLCMAFVLIGVGGRTDQEFLSWSIRAISRSRRK
jgi:hypothetical protein